MALSASVPKGLRASIENKLTIETGELEELMRGCGPEVAVLNATIPRRDYVPREDHAKERIKDSIFLDFKGFCDSSSGLSYTMPNLDHFTHKMKEINVGKNHLVVVYDKYRNISAPRTHFMLNQVFGIPNVWLLNGTFDKW
jgi:3-mercaptopyruvate sulfurtransferase SseA